MRRWVRWLGAKDEAGAVDVPARLVLAMVALGMLAGAALAPDETGEGGWASLAAAAGEAGTALVEGLTDGD